MTDMPNIPGADPADRPSLQLAPGGHRRAVMGHPWIFSNEIRMDAAAKALAPGTLVRLRELPGVERTRTSILLDTQFEREPDPAALGGDPA